MFTRALITLLISALLSAPALADSDSGANLDGLSKNFLWARSLPPGSRPDPVVSDLAFLEGARLSAIRRALGPADDPDPRWKPPDCLAPLCLVWTYGPTEAVTSEDRDDGNNTVTVTTGGPFLLVLGFRANRVISAQWLGQK